MSRRKRVTYRPSKANGILGLVFGGIFVLIGLVLVIPTFGLFGLLWTLAALSITVYQAKLALGHKYMGPEIHIEDEEDPDSAAPRPEEHDHIPSTALDARHRLEQLKSLLDAGLLTKEEYDAKRKEILRDL